MLNIFVLVSLSYVIHKHFQQDSVLLPQKSWTCCNIIIAQHIPLGALSLDTKPNKHVEFYLIVFPNKFSGRIRLEAGTETICWVENKSY